MDDSQLYTGTTSSTFTPKPQEVVQKKQQEKQEKRAKLVPSAHIVLEEIDKEITKALNIEELAKTSFVFAKDTEARLEAQHKYVAYLRELKSRMNNILREPAKKVETDE